MKESFSDKKEYVDYFSRLVRFEMEEQRIQSEYEIRKFPPKFRQKIGKTLLDMNAKYMGKNFYGEYVFQFGLPYEFKTDISPSDVVLVTPIGKDPLRFGIEGTCIKKGKRFLQIVFSQDIRSVRAKKWRVDLYSNDVTFKRMLSALERFFSSSYFLEDILLGKKENVAVVEDVGCGVVELNRSFLNDLNPSQRKVVKKAVEFYAGSCPRILLVHGPFGTGKTKTVVYTLKALVDALPQGLKVMATADSNTATDVLAERVAQLGLKVLRFGAHISSKYSVEWHLKNDAWEEEAQALKKLDVTLETLKDYQNKIGLKPSPAHRRGMSDEEIKKFARLGTPKRGVSAKVLKMMANWLKVQDLISAMVKLRENLNRFILLRLLDFVDVVVTTNSSSALLEEMGLNVNELVSNFNDVENLLKVLKREKILGADFELDKMIKTCLRKAEALHLAPPSFPILVIDEASQAMEPSALIPLSVTNPKLLILAGDHKQLPPVVLSKNAAPLSFTLFERLIFQTKQGFNLPVTYQLLDTQYRMNEKICRLVSELFYDGKVKTAPEVMNIVLSDIMDASKCQRFGLSDEFSLILSDEPVVLINVDGVEKRDKLTKSFWNEIEGEVVIRILLEILNCGVGNIGIITPYAAQKRYLEERVVKISSPFKSGVVVNTVDGFQGQEKEVIIVSFVRANNKGEVGFLEDKRRVCVALSRAKRKLILVGNFKTLKRNILFSKVLRKDDLKSVRWRFDE